MVFLVPSLAFRYVFSCILGENLINTTVQVGLVALAILVTRSSVASLQAKQGLPVGTQMAGWVTFGKMSCFSIFHFVAHFLKLKGLRLLSGYRVVSLARKSLQYTHTRSHPARRNCDFTKS